MPAIMSRPQCAKVTHLRRDPKQISCLQSKVFWVVHHPETPASDCLGGWMVYRPPYPIITQRNIHFKAWIFLLNMVDSLIFFYLYVADILIQYIYWNYWKNWKIWDSRCRFLTRPIWPFYHESFASFSFDWPLNAPMLFQNVNNCLTNISDLLWQLTIKAVNDVRSKNKLSNKSPVDGFPSNYHGRKTVMSLTVYSYFGPKYFV